MATLQACKLGCASCITWDCLAKACVLYSGHPRTPWLTVVQHPPTHFFCSPSLTLISHTMPIAPITGMLRKRFWLDVSCALGLGVTGGYAYWYVLIAQHDGEGSSDLDTRYGIHLKECE